MSHVTYHFIFDFFLGVGQSGGASRWMVCNQRGLPRLVSNDLHILQRILTFIWNILFPPHLTTSNVTHCVISTNTETIKLIPKKIQPFEKMIIEEKKTVCFRTLAGCSHSVTEDICIYLLFTIRLGLTHRQVKITKN